MEHSWMVVALVLVCHVMDINATINPSQPFLAASCKEHIYISQLNQDTLDFSVDFDASFKVGSISYDPVEEKLYYVDERSSGGIFTLDLDGTNSQEIHNMPRSGISINLETRKIFAIGTYGQKGAYEHNLDGSVVGPISPLTTTDWRSATSIGSLNFAVDNFPSAMKGVDTNGDIAVEYQLPSAPRHLDIDPLAGDLYYIEFNSYPMIINRLKVNDVNGTCVQNIISTDPDVRIDPRSIFLYGDYLYVNTGDGIGKVDKRGGNYTIIHEASGGCESMYIYDPAKIKAAEGFGSDPGTFAGFIAPDDMDDPDVGNVTIPVNIHIRKPWFGGMIADLVIPIHGAMSDWRLEISFPRQVFNLEIEGCSAEVSKKVTRGYGRRRGTDYTIVPTGASRSPPPGEDLSITIIASTFKKVRNMKRGISTEFFPVFDVISCDVTPPLIM